MNIRHILVPLDGSWLSEQALPYADDLARRSGVKLTLMGVRFPPTSLWDDGSSPRLPPREYLLAETLQYLEGHAARLTAAGLQVEVASPLGNPAECILDFAETRAVDLIIMTSHGRTGLRRWVQGSAAERVIRHAVCPTLVIGLETLRHLQDRVG